LPFAVVADVNIAWCLYLAVVAARVDRSISKVLVELAATAWVVPAEIAASDYRRSTLVLEVGRRS
jgi:hypothetical protein